MKTDFSCFHFISSRFPLSLVFAFVTQSNNSAESCKFFSRFLVFINNFRFLALGGLFHGGDDEQTQIAFRSAFDRVNFESVTHEFVVKMFNISRTGSFEAQQHVCQLASEGAQAFFGPGTVETTGIVSSIADKFEIPHIMYHWKTKPMWNLNAVNDHKMTHNFYPDADVLGDFHVDSIELITHS